MRVSARLLLRCFFRSYMVGAAYNPRGLQNVGFLYALEPGLAALYDDKHALRNARFRHARHFNSHPFFTPMLLGAYLRMEEGIVQGRLSAQAFAGLKEVAANTLSGIGDSFFNGTCLNTWALCCATLVCLEQPLSAFVLSVSLLLMVQAFKLATFIMGWRLGMSILILMKRLDLINWGERLKCFNALLLVIFLLVAIPDADAPVWTITGVCLLAACWVTGKLHANRVVLALFLIFVIVALHLAGFLEHLSIEKFAMFQGHATP